MEVNSGKILLNLEITALYGGEDYELGDSTGS
jgi:hypothetical protein